MKKTMAFLIFCSLCSLGSLGVLLLQDQKLGVPLPYSLPMATAAMLVAAPVLFFAANKVRMNRPVVVSLGSARPPARGTNAPPPAPRPRPAEGVVLLDFSRAREERGRAA